MTLADGVIVSFAVWGAASATCTLVGHALQHAGPRYASVARRFLAAGVWFAKIREEEQELEPLVAEAQDALDHVRDNLPPPTPPAA